MFLSGNDVAKSLKNVNEKQIQPAGVDLTVDKIWKINDAGELDFSNDNRKIPAGEEMPFTAPVHLEPGAYIVRYGQEISIPDDCIGIVLPRSSLMRMGATLISALWDPGYLGRGKGLLHIMNVHGVVLHPNARIGQLIFIKGRPGDTYDGAYLNEV